MILADTGAIIALIDADDRNHEALLDAYESDPDGWVLPWAILPEVDHLLTRHVDTRAGVAFLRDVADGRYAIEWGNPLDLIRAAELVEKYRALDIGLVDAVVMAQAERLKAPVIATLDTRHFGAVRLHHSPALWPRDRQQPR